MRCPFARWSPSDRPALLFSGGPAKIVHHTTEGSSIAGAEGAYKAAGSWPHFTISADEIVQHIDTAFAARALRNDPGGVHTNTDTAYQIEVVGYAAKAKHMRTLANVARVCRWLEEVHGVNPIWPNGFPKVAVNGRDPGGHNRNASTWDTRSGHYGHCHVPENSHWDPGYTADEVRQITPPPAQREEKMTPEQLALLQATHDKARDAVNYGVAILEALNQFEETTTVGVDAETIAARVDELLAKRLAE